MAKEPSINERGRAPAGLIEKVGAKEDRKIRARREKDRGVWFGLGMFGLVRDRYRPGNLDRYQMAQSVFLDPDVSCYWRPGGVPQCMVLD